MELSDLKRAPKLTSNDNGGGNSLMMANTTDEEIKTVNTSHNKTACSLCDKWASRQGGYPGKEEFISRLTLQLHSDDISKQDQGRFLEDEIGRLKKHLETLRFGQSNELENLQRQRANISNDVEKLSLRLEERKREREKLTAKLTQLKLDRDQRLLHSTTRSRVKGPRKGKGRRI